MQIHELKLSKKRKRGKRVGRGGKRGIYSGRGNKGQKARTNKRLKLKRIGSSLSRHLPKIGGFKSLYPRAQSARLSVIEGKFAEGERITLKALQSKGIIRNANKPVKILSGGKFSKKFTIEGISISKRAKEQIEKAGGAVK